MDDQELICDVCDEPIESCICDKIKYRTKVKVKKIKPEGYTGQGKKKRKPYDRREPDGYLHEVY